MNDELNQHISQFFDDELDNKVALNLLQKMQANPDLKDTLNRYATISHALKTDEFLPVSSDFSAKIARQIEHEAIYLLPPRKSAKRNYKITALAASVAIVAVLASRGLNNTVTPVETAATSQLAQAQQTPAKKIDQPVNTTQPEPYPLNARINDYLQAHNSSVYTDDQTDIRPLGKLTAYSQK